MTSGDEHIPRAHFSRSTMLSTRLSWERAFFDGTPASRGPSSLLHSPRNLARGSPGPTPATRLLIQGSLPWSKGCSADPGSGGCDPALGNFGSRRAPVAISDTPQPE